MHFYQHHIGDFDKATRHLTRLERSVYRDLIELYYDTEQQLTLDMAALCRRIIARSNEEATAVEQVLNEFFSKTPTGWYHDRCEEEIELYRSSKSQKSIAGRASAAKRAEKRQQAFNARSTDVEQTCNGTPTNQEPITINQEPTKETPSQSDGKPAKKRRSSDEEVTADHMVSFSNALTLATAQQYLAHRKQKRALLTPAAWGVIVEQVIKAGMNLQDGLAYAMNRGWTGFDAKWIDGGTGSPRQPQQMSLRDASRLGAARSIFGDEREQSTVIDISPELGSGDFQEDAGTVRLTVG